MEFNNVESFICLWNQLAKQNGLKGFYFIGYTLLVGEEYRAIKEKGFDAVCSCRLKRHFKKDIGWFFRKTLSYVTNMPEVYSYKSVYPTLLGDEERTKDDVFPTLIPNWDHTPRSGRRGYLFSNSTPELFEKHCEDVLKVVNNKKAGRRIAFLKSWNEWGEGNYMEPDMKYGKGYIIALRTAIDNIVRGNGK